ncbi:MAG: T9SS type A sorting domain-containing protein, partial [Chitinophagales bacterium]
TFLVNSNASIQLALFNVLGKRIETLLEENVSEGEHRFILDSSQLPAGIYFLQLTITSNVPKMNAEIMMKKLVIQKQ